MNIPITITKYFPNGRNPGPGPSVQNMVNIGPCWGPLVVKEFKVFNNQMETDLKVLEKNSVSNYKSKEILPWGTKTFLKGQSINCFIS